MYENFYDEIDQSVLLFLTQFVKRKRILILKLCWKFTTIDFQTTTEKAAKMLTGGYGGASVFKFYATGEDYSGNHATKKYLL